MRSPLKHWRCTLQVQPLLRLSRGPDHYYIVISQQKIMRSNIQLLQLLATCEQIQFFKLHTQGQMLTLFNNVSDMYAIKCGWTEQPRNRSYLPIATLLTAACLQAIVAYFSLANWESLVNINKIYLKELN